MKMDGPLVCLSVCHQVAQYADPKDKDDSLCMMDMQGKRNSVKIVIHIDMTIGVGEGSVLGPLIFMIKILKVSPVMEIV